MKTETTYVTREQIPLTLAHWYVSNCSRPIGASLAAAAAGSLVPFSAATLAPAIPT